MVIRVVEHLNKLNGVYRKEAVLNRPIGMQWDIGATGLDPRKWLSMEKKQVFQSVIHYDITVSQG